MKNHIVRKKFFDFFKAHEHHITNPAPLLNHEDPSLLFVNSGMVPFKGILLGNKTSTHKRIVNIQPCLRVAGKHNDLEDVGLDTYHHTFFEMLGHWSFGDYFKEEAIQYAWKLLTQVYDLPKDRLYATIFQGDPQDNLTEDHEAYKLWQNYLPSTQILKASKADNFWEMGPQGPCGPCTEVHIDLRSQKERQALPGHKLVNQDHPQVIEIGNWVFIQYNRLASGKLIPLPQKHVDTGIGFERLCMTLQGVSSTYDTDLFTPLIKALEDTAQRSYGSDPKVDIAMRVIVDHLRAITFGIAEGIIPSSQQAGYVMRRLLRRAVRYGYSFLHFTKPFLHSLVPLLTKQMSAHYPLLEEQAKAVQDRIAQEEENFLATLTQGVKRFTHFTQSLPKETKELNGKAIFELYDTYGFPPDLTALMAREQGYTIDQKGFKSAMAEQKNRSKQAASETISDWVSLEDQLIQSSKFVGYDQLTMESKVVQYRTLQKKGETYYQLVLSVTPFYAEAGGQVGDQGILKFGNEEILVTDTQRENNLILHYTKALPKELKKPCQAIVDKKKRLAAARNHTATHLLQAALQQVLGTQIQQRGSFVSPKMLRFDFDHNQKIDQLTLSKIEQEVNHQIRRNIPLEEHRQVPIAEAKAMGARALFTEKYGKEVRVIAFDPSYSMELCGGTHVSATGQIGYCKLTVEKSIAAGTRRIEAITGEAVEEWIKSLTTTYDSITQLIPHRSPLKGIQQLIQEKKKLQKEIEKFQTQQINTQLKSLQDRVATQKKSFIIEEVNIPSDTIFKKMLFAAKQYFPDQIIILINKLDKLQVSIGILVPLNHSTSWKASTLLDHIGHHIEAKGGGSDTFAFATGSQRGLKALREALSVIG